MVPVVRVPFWVRIFDPQPHGFLGYERGAAWAHPCRPEMRLSGSAGAARLGAMCSVLGPPVVPFHPLFWGMVALLKQATEKNRGTNFF